MGWDGEHYPKELYNRDGLDGFFTGKRFFRNAVELGKGTKINNHYYRAFKNSKTGERFILVVSLSYDRRHGDLYYKMEDDGVGPCDCKCPKRILNEAGGIDGACNDCGRKWREKCYSRFKTK